MYLSIASNAPVIPPNIPANDNAPIQVLRSDQSFIELGAITTIADIAPETKPLTNLSNVDFIFCVLFLFIYYLTMLI
mgnify:CR=1 FL=1